MEDEKLRKTRMRIYMFILILIIIIVVILFFSKINYKKYKEEINSNVNNIINNNNKISTNIIETDEENNVSDNLLELVEETNENQTNEIVETEEEETEQYLEFDYRLSTYFLTKYFLTTYYEGNSISAKESLIDSEAIGSYATSLFDWVDNNYYNKATFTIDEIYIQGITDTMNILLVYYRYTEDNESFNESVMAIRVDVDTRTFSVYPYEYLKANNFDKLKEYNTLEITNSDTIEENDYNKYDVDTIEYDLEACSIELFEKYRFDILVDPEHLYNLLNEEYKEERFNTYEEFLQYVEEKRETINYDDLYKYKCSSTEDGIRIIDSTKQNKYLIFDIVENLMEYTVMLDSYTISLSTNYEDSLPAPQASYCIQRIFNAINEENYDFVYERLNDVQKNNYYSTEEEFIEYIKDNFFENNTYEIDDEYLIVSTDVYQFKVYVTDADGISSGTKTFSITISLEDGTDFQVKINSE